MKKLTLILLFIALIIALSCKEEDTVQMGCQTGILKGTTGPRVLIRCSTKEQHLAGDNTAAGGTPSFSYYTSVQWTAVDDCKDCL